ncbi:MAG: hypothetical protein Q9214_002948 [Letrouitia sp. 1 TL-2023]
MASKRVLLLGGHGKVSLLLTSQLLARSWQVTSVIRDSSQTNDILTKANGQPGKVDVLVRSLEDIQSEQDAQRVIQSSSPDYVVWSAGAGGKGGPSRTVAIDRDSCIYFIRAAANTPSIRKFLLVSYLGSRRAKAPWWSEEEWRATQQINSGVLKNYYPAKLAADECLTAVARTREDEFKAIILRPGSLTDEEGAGRVSLGKIKARGSISRGDVAAVAARLLESEASGWLDLLEGEEDIGEAVDRVIRDGVDCTEGEDVDFMEKTYLK